MDLRYVPIYEDVDSLSIGRIYEEIKEDAELEIADELPDGRLSHIVIKGTQKPVGYIGDDSLEVVYNHEGKESFEILKARIHLADIYHKIMKK